MNSDFDPIVWFPKKTSNIFFIIIISTQPLAFLFQPMLTTIWTTSLAYLRSFFFSAVLAPCLVLRWGWTLVLYWFSAWFPSRILLSLSSAVIPIRESFNPWAIPRTIGFKSLIIEKIFFVQMFLFSIFFTNSLSRPPSANLVTSPS